MANETNVFEALPHVNSIWINESGEYWLHPKAGCKEVKRGESEPEKPKKTKEAKPKE